MSIKHLCQDAKMFVELIEMGFSTNVLMLSSNGPVSYIPTLYAQRVSLFQLWKIYSQESGFSEIRFNELQQRIKIILKKNETVECKHATSMRPYGPFSDRWCSSNDTLPEACIILSSQNS